MYRVVSGKISCYFLCLLKNLEIPFLVIKSQVVHPTNEKFIKSDVI